MKRLIYVFIASIFFENRNWDIVFFVIHATENVYAENILQCIKSLFWKCFGEDGDIDFSVMRDKIYM